MMRALLLALLLLPGCAGHQLTGYNLKGTLGQTVYEDGSHSTYTGATVDAHFDVKR